MMFPLETLLSVRRYREDAAQSAMRNAERALREAMKAVETSKEELAQFKIWREQEVERRYDAIMGNSLSLTMLNEFKSGLGILEQQELAHEEAVRAATNDAEKKREAVIKARQAASLARKETAKIETLKDLWKKETKKQAEYSEEIELEDFHALPLNGLQAADDDATQGALL